MSPTLGKIDDLQSAADEHRHSDEARPKHSHREPPYDEEDVTGGPTLGSINELRFAHHAHHPDLVAQPPEQADEADQPASDE